ACHGGLHLRHPHPTNAARRVRPATATYGVGAFAVALSGGGPARACAHSLSSSAGSPDARIGTRAAASAASYVPRRLKVAPSDGVVPRSTSARSITKRAVRASAP